MGVTGLWRLIEPTGKPVPVETLENKVLAVDISIWLHQMVKGYQDAKGAPLPNAHLMGLFQRLCKLLYFRIKPIFVFDGGFPDLKKETIARRNESKSKYNSASERLKRELALLLGKKTAVSTLLGKQISPKKGSNAEANIDDIFKLPALPEKEESESESEDEHSSDSVIDLHSVDLESENFRNLPVKEKYDLLIELKETRKQNSWGRLHQLPKKSDNFSDFQVQRLLKRRKVQECLQETEKEIGDTGMSLNELESFLNDVGIDTNVESLPSRRIASNNTTRFVLISDVKQAIAEAKKKLEAVNNPGPSEEKDNTEVISQKRDELEDDLEKAIKMSLDCGNDPDTSAYTSKTDDSWTSVMTDSDYEDSEEEDGFEQPDLSSAKAYIMQYSDFTNKAIDELVISKTGKKITTKVPDVDQIIEELNNEKSVIVDKVDLSSSDDDCIQDNKIVEVQNQSIIELNDMSQNVESSTNMDATQSSVVYVENPVQDTIALDTSTDEDGKQIKPIPIPTVHNDKVVSTKLEVELNPTSMVKNTDSDSDSDDDFEEVSDVDNRSSKPVVQVTLNLNEKPNDDIFADVFCNYDKPKPDSPIPSTSFDTGQMKQNKADEVYKVMETISKISKDINMMQKPKFMDEIIDTISNSCNSEVKIVTKVTGNTPCNTFIGNKLKSTTQTTPIIVPTEKPNEGTKGTIAAEITDTVGIHNRIHDSNNPHPSDRPIEQQDEVATKTISKPPKEPISTEKLNSMVEEIEIEEQDLLQEKGRLDRIGRNITEQMTKEAQELLQIFGIPYIVAPTEAEAQCAFLESVNLTDGTITDDSDIWLFGGRTVYKNFFNQKKHVLQFLAERIERSFNLTREQLVLLALLVGSDYTTGVAGVGPVTALEILASFPFNKKHIANENSKQARYAKIVAGLQEFKQWVRAGRRTDNTTLKKKLRNVQVTDDFPSVRVVQAYMEPNVEQSKEKFTWGELDITVLRDYTKAKFGWSQNKLDEIVKPVLKRLLERKTQRSVQDYFKKKIKFHSLEDQMSKRVKAAVQKMVSDEPVEENEDIPLEKKKVIRKRKINENKGVHNPEDNGTGPSKTKQKLSEESVLKNHGVKVMSHIRDGKSTIEINIPKTDRSQEFIPQREKDKQSLLENKLKAIELFRKTKIDRKKKTSKRRANLPKEKAELSESSDSD